MTGHEQCERAAVLAFRHALKDEHLSTRAAWAWAAAHWVEFLPAGDADARDAPWELVPDPQEVPLEREASAKQARAKRQAGMVRDSLQRHEQPARSDGHDLERS